MDIYCVGGAVRDHLLGRAVHDRDWVVVGAQAQDLLNLGFTPVGRDFPVFLHPVTKEEVALARTERKSGAGYRGFEVHASPEVTLEEDLSRRDLTINAMAVRLPLGSVAEVPPPGLQIDPQALHDPFQGQRDLKQRVLRHVTPAFREDPVRILRLARFAARLADFSVHPDTLALARDMVEGGEADALVPERVWQELSRGLMEARPSRLLQVLRDCGALARVLPELDALWGVPQRAEHHPEVDTGAHMLLVMDECARAQAPLEVRFAALVHDLGKGTTPTDLLPRHHGHEQRSLRLLRQVAERLRVPQACRELAEVVAQEHGHIHASASLGAAALLRLLQRCDALRRPERFHLALQACACDARGRLGLQDRPYPQAERLAQALAVVQSVDAQAVVQAAQASGLQGPALGVAVARAYEQALADWLGQAQ
jgi:tRNA nucleotidyltransferase (CCA-adding enzyme)